MWKEYLRNYFFHAIGFAKAEGVLLKSEHAEVEAPFNVVTELIFESWGDLEAQNPIATLPDNKALLSEDEKTLFGRQRCFAAVCEVLAKICRLPERRSCSPMPKAVHQF